MAAEVLPVRKRGAVDEAETTSRPPTGKKARFQDLSTHIDSEAGGKIFEAHSPHNESTPYSPQSFASTDAQSIAETSMTSRSSSKRPKKYICDFDGCTKAFDRPVRLQAHVRTHTDDRPFACEEEGCAKRFFKAEHLKAHVQNKHSNDASFVCTYVLSTNEADADIACGKAFTTATRLRRHVAAHEEKEERKCHEPGCGRVFRKMETLQRHIKKDHLNEPSFRCTHPIHDDHLTGTTAEQCGQTFSTVSQLKAHEIKQHIGKKYFCSTCSSSLTSSSSTSNNNDMNMTNEPLGFHTYASYQSHLKSLHPPTCTLCNRPCASNRALAAHMEIEHSTLSSRRQKFKCSHPGCERGFTKRGNLNVHVQNVHVKRKRYNCGGIDLGGNSGKVPGWKGGEGGGGSGWGCGRSFGTKGNLEEHVRTQHLGLPSLYHPRKSGARIKQEEEEDPTLSLLTGHAYASTRPLPCWTAPTCPVRFFREYDLARHMELAHGWNVDDVNDRLAEEAALEGGRFWIGGVEGGDDAGDAGDGDGEVRGEVERGWSFQVAMGMDGGGWGGCGGEDGAEGVFGSGICGFEDGGEGGFLDGMNGFEGVMMGKVDPSFDVRWLLLRRRRRRRREMLSSTRR